MLTTNDATTTNIAAKRDIFAIEAELEQIAMGFDQLADTGTEEELLNAIESYFGDLLDERDRKLDGYARFVNSYLAKAEMRKAEAARLSAMAKTDENAAKRLKDRLKYYFEVNGITKIETKFHKISVAGNGGVQPLTISSDVEEDPKLLPESFRVVTVTVDKDAVRKELAKPDEEQDPIVRQHCVLEPRGTSLRIK